MVARKKPNPLEGEDYWRSVVNDLKGPFPETGNEPPAFEVVEVKVDTSTLQGRLLKMSTDVYVFLGEDATKGFVVSTQHRMLDYGEMNLPDAVLKARRSRRL